MASNEILKVRIIAKGTHGHTQKPVENIEFEVTPEYRNIILNDATCVLK